MPRLTHIAHDWIRERLNRGDHALDATAGNGHDTCFLAEEVGAEGSVYAFDLQARAIQSTRDLLEAKALHDRATLVRDSHANLNDHLPDDLDLGAAMWNLGYLPGSDHDLVTTPESTIASLEAAFLRLKPSGVLTAILYRGHPGGMEEAKEVYEWFKRQGAHGHEIRERLASERNETAPQLVGLFRKQPD